MCIGLDHCSKKNCLEQARCIFGLWPTYIEFIPRGSKRTRKKRSQNKEPIKPMCEIENEWCSNKRACEILGQCILKHPLILADNMALKQLRKPLSMDSVVKIITRLMPSLNRKNKRK